MLTRPDYLTPAPLTPTSRVTTRVRCFRPASSRQLREPDSQTIMRVPANVARRLGWYVYVYVNPLDRKVFYVGKGKGARCLAHLDVGGRSDKARILADIRRAGQQPRIEILAHGLSDEETAFRVEAAAIDLLELSELTNVVRGKRALELGRAPLPELIAIYSRRPVKVREPAVLIRITRLYRPNMTPIELYDVTRGVWVVGQQRERAKYAFAVFEGIVREVYEIKQWLPAGSTLYTRPAESVEDEERWEFVGRLAPDPLRRRYIDRDVSGHLTPGSRNPIQYVNTKGT